MSTSILHNAIKCTVCQSPFFSLEIDPNSRNLELIQKLTAHYNNKHKEELIRATNNSKSVAELIVMHIFLNNLAIVPEENATLSDMKEEVQEKILEVLGFVPQESEDEEDDDEENDTEELELMQDFEDIQKSADSNTAEKLQLFKEKYLSTTSIPLETSDHTVS